MFGSCDWFRFFFILETFKKSFTQYFGVLTERVVVLDFEAFWSKESDFIIIELKKLQNPLAHSFILTSTPIQIAYFEWTEILSVGFKIYKRFGLREGRLPILLSATISTV